MTGPRGTLYLVPVPLGGENVSAVLPGSVLAVVHRLHYFIAEHPRSARRFLKGAGYPHPLQETEIATLDEHTAEAALPGLIAPLFAGRDCGLMSEAGCPALADPGAVLVRLAHRGGVRVVPLVGPSAVLLAVMASGLNGQHFTFHGYLPASSAERRRRLREIESAAAHSGAAQAFIETPYRNAALVQTMLETCRDDTLLCIAADITLPEESIATRPIAEWKQAPPDLARRPAVFVLWRAPQ